MAAVPTGYNIGDYDPNRQAGTTANPLAQSATYTPPGEQAPVDQYNWTPDPSAPGGFIQTAPGVAGPLDQPNFSTATNQPPDAAQMAQSAASSIDLTPTVTASGTAQIAPTSGESTGWGALSSSDQNIWNSTYGNNAGQYQYGVQNGGAANPAGFNALPLDQQNTWYGTYGANAPQVWAQQSQQNNLVQQMSAGSPVPTNSPAAPNTIGYNNFGRDMVKINPQNTPYLGAGNASSPGYIQGSGSYNQWDLGQAGLFGQIAGVGSNMQYGSGSIGDPTHGKAGDADQTPQEWVNAPKAFSWEGNMDGDLGYIGNLFGRSDTNSGIGTPAWSAPKQYWDGLAQQVAGGRVKPTSVGWAALLQKGYTPQMIGGGAVAQAATVGVQANGAGASATGGAAAGSATGPMGAGTAGFNAAYAQNQTTIRGQDLQYAYLNERMKLLEIPEMQNKTALELDKLAFDRAKQSYLEQYQNQQAEEAKRQFDVLDTSRVAGITGQYNGQDTMAMQAQKQNQTMQYLQMMGQLRGPADIFQYMKVLNGTPGGMKDMVNAAAGQYTMPTFGGGATVGGAQVGGGAADINSVLAQMNSGNYGQSETQGLNLPAPNQINALALQRMTPTQQQALLAAYESAGYRPEDVMAIFKNSLPSYGASGGGASPATQGQVNLFGR